MEKIQRYFIAYMLPAQIALNLYKTTQKHFIKDALKIRWVPPENYHITLKFLGGLSHIQTEKIKAALSLYLHNQPHTEATLQNLCFFPSDTQPHVLVRKVIASNTLLNLTNGLEQLMSPKFIPSEKRAFQAHVTLARIHNRKDIMSLFQNINQQTIPISINHVALMQSAKSTIDVSYNLIRQWKLHA